MNFINLLKVSGIFVYILLFAFLFSCKQEVHKTNIENMHSAEKAITNDSVLDESSAIIIAEEAWLKKYGENIYKRKPFKAKLVNDTLWEVTGTLHTSKGGVPHAEIRKSDGKVIKIYHDK